MDKQLAKEQMRQYINHIFEDCEDYEEKINVFWDKVIDNAWTAPEVERSMKGNITQSELEALEKIDTDLLREIIVEMGYDPVDFELGTE